MLITVNVPQAGNFENMRFSGLFLLQKFLRISVHGDAPQKGYSFRVLKLFHQGTFF